MSIETMGNVLRETKEVTNMMYNPMIKKWGLYFDRANGYDNRATIVKAFADFFENTGEEKLEIPGKCVLGGKVYGRYGFKDGNEILTSNIQSVERIERGDCNGVPHDLMCATIGSGSKYYFYSDEHSAYMFMLLGDMIHTGKLNQEPYHYLSLAFFGSQFI